LKQASHLIKNISDIPNKEARILLAHYLKKDQIWLLTHENDEVEIDGYFRLIDKRAKNEPIEYITNSANFYSREFYVDSRVLIPRPETELLVDEVISTCKGLKAPSIVEIGTGSGIIAIMLALMLPDANITAIDISQGALDVAKKNAEKFALKDRITFIQSDLLDNVKDKNFDVLVSNPPYIANDESLHVGLSYEPNLALFGGIKGDEILKNIFYLAKQRNVSCLLCEMGYDQKTNVKNFAKEHNINFYKDLAGLDRGFIIKF
jgi:release factor glutamine methyltransferase